MIPNDKPPQQDLVITRIFDAPRDLVFRAWTDPKHVAQWWGPHGFTTPVCELDVRPGGAIRIDMQGPDGVMYPSKGVFHEVVPPERLVFTTEAFEDAEGKSQLEVLNTVTFAEYDGKTKLTLQSEIIRSSPAVAAALDGMAEGWNQSLDRLTEHLEQSLGETMMATTKREPKTERNLDGYGAPPIPWTKVRERLEQGLTQAPETGGPNRHTCWLATVRPDGRPHVMPVGILWVDGAMYFNAGAATRKAMNLAQNPHCVITVATHDFDLVVEGKAVKVTDPAKAQRIAEAYRSDGDGWPASVVDGTASLTADYSAPSAGPPPWDIYEVTPETVFALGTAEPGGVTRWQF
jgi:uncharacterized protein YndB with AHSA1/START domain